MHVLKKSINFKNLYFPSFFFGGVGGGVLAFRYSMETTTTQPKQTITANSNNIHVYFVVYDLQKYAHIINFTTNYLF